MRKNWIKLPDGTLTRHKPDPLALFLAEHQPARYATPSPPAPPKGTGVDGSPSGERGYSTESFDISKLAGFEITQFGAGSVGSHLTCALGPAGLTINVIDPGIVQARHATGGRTAYDPTQVGLKKAHALEQKINQNCTGTVIHPLPYNTAEIPDTELTSMLRRSLAVILAVDDPRQILRISDLAYPITEIIQPAIHAKGESGHIALSIPFVSPCLRCTLDITDATDIHRLDSEPASGLDITSVAREAARIALDIAYSKVTGRPIRRWDITKNLVYLSNTKDELSPDGPGIHFLDGSQRRPDCPVCNNHTAA
jgi:hypothetical protein